MRHHPITLSPLGSAPLQLSLLLPFLFLVVGLYVDTPSCYHRKPVDLPFSAKAPFVPYTDRDIDIWVQSDGMIFIDAKWYPLPAFREKLLEFREGAPQKHIVLKADRSLSFGEVRTVLLALRAAGFERLTILTFEGLPAHLISRTAA